MLVSNPRVIRSALLAGAVALSVSLAGCSSGDAEPAPSTTVSEQTSAEQSAAPTPVTPSTSAAPSVDESTAAGTSARAPRTAGGSAGAGDATTLSCREFRALEDEARAAAVAALGVKSKADQVATVAATVCLNRLDDKVVDVVGELVPTR